MVTVVVSVASFINLGYFNFERKAPWLWFLVYLASVAVSGLFLRRARARSSAKGVTLNPVWRGYMPVESAILGLYGVGLLLFPLTFGGIWPWPVDAFHAQVYSAIFLAGAGGTYLVWRSTPREELLVLGLAQRLALHRAQALVPRHQQCELLLLSVICTGHRQFFQHRKGQPFGVCAASDVEEPSLVVLQNEPCKFVLESF